MELQAIVGVLKFALFCDVKNSVGLKFHSLRLETDRGCCEEDRSTYLIAFCRGFLMSGDRQASVTAGH
jgi:hypothetical protein